MPEISIDPFNSAFCSHSLFGLNSGNFPSLPGSSFLQQRWHCSLVLSIPRALSALGFLGLSSWGHMWAMRVSRAGANPVLEWLSFLALMWILAFMVHGTLFSSFCATTRPTARCLSRLLGPDEPMVCLQSCWNSSGVWAGAYLMHILCMWYLIFNWTLLGWKRSWQTSCLTITGSRWWLHLWRSRRTSKMYVASMSRHISFAWKASHELLNCIGDGTSFLNSVKAKFDPGDIPLCGCCLDEDSIEHRALVCPLFQGIRKWVSSWCSANVVLAAFLYDSPWLAANSVLGCLEHNSMGGSCMGRWFTPLRYWVFISSVDLWQGFLAVGGWSVISANIGQVVGGRPVAFSHQPCTVTVVKFGPAPWPCNADTLDRETAVLHTDTQYALHGCIFLQKCLMIPILASVTKTFGNMCCKDCFGMMELSTWKG